MGLFSGRADCEQGLGELPLALLGTPKSCRVRDMVNIPWLFQDHQELQGQGLGEYPLALLGTPKGCWTRDHT